MRIDLELECDLVMRYYRKLCGTNTCLNCDYWSELRGFCSNRDNMLSLSDIVDNIIENSLDGR